MIYANWVASGCEARGEQPVPDYAQPSPLEDVETGPDTADTSQCYQGIPLPGDPGYQGCCVQVDGKWQLDPDRKRLTRPEERMRYARL